MISWRHAFENYFKKRIFLFFFLGFSCGLPYNLLGYSLSLWMTDVGTALSVIGFFSLVFVPYSLKFLWAPFVDRFDVPFLSDKLGRKKSWALVFQTGLILGIFLLAFYGPDQNTWILAHHFSQDHLSAGIPMQTFLLALAVAFFASSQDIVVDALRIDTLKKEEMGEGAGMYQFGYRMGMLLSGAGVVAAASFLSWRWSYFLVGCFVLSGLVSVFFIQEEKKVSLEPRHHLLKALVWDPLFDFMRKKAWGLILVFIVLYKICNAVLGRMALPFYRDIGFSNEQIALVSGAFGPWITILGIALGGMCVMRFPLLKCLLYLGGVEIATSVAFAVFASVGASLPFFFAVIVFDNIIGGMGGAVFVAFLSLLCSKKYAATQYALLSSLMAVAAAVIATMSGVWAQQMGWIVFFLFTGVLMLPALFLLSYLSRFADPLDTVKKNDTMESEESL